MFRLAIQQGVGRPAEYAAPPAILLIVVTLNSAETLSRCLESFVSQTYKNKKLVVIDGGSSDGTVNIIARYEPQIAYWVSEADEGIYDAWNKALHCGVKADWIQFMGADDYYYDDEVLSRVAHHLDHAFPKYLLAYTKVNAVGPAGESQQFGVPWNRAVFFGTGSMQDGSSIQVGYFHHRDLFDKYGYFDKTFKIVGDLEFVLRYLTHHDPYFIESVVSVNHVLGGISSNEAYATLQKHEHEKAFERHGFIFKDIVTMKIYRRLIKRTKKLLSLTLGAKLSNKIIVLSRVFFGEKSKVRCSRRLQRRSL